jgi:hypothetical protein
MTSFEKNALAAIDEKQNFLSEKHITPNIKAFEQAFYCFREILDEIWLTGKCDQINSERLAFLQRQVAKFKQNFRLVVQQQYPIGMCFPITKIAFVYLHRFEINDPASAFYPLKAFTEEGGVFKVIWGEVRHEVFQTSMQMGFWYFDTANDTVFLYKPKVLNFQFSSPECEFHEITSIEQYIQIKQSYHNCTIYRNTVFPMLAPYFPLLVKNNTDGKIQIDVSEHISGLMIKSNFTFLKSSVIPLPTEELFEWIEKKLQSSKGKYQFPELLEFKKMTAGEVAGLQTRESPEKIKKAAHYINFLLRS